MTLQGPKAGEFKRTRGGKTSKNFGLFLSELFENISHGYVSGVKESNSDNKQILSEKARSNTVLRDLSYLRLQT